MRRAVVGADEDPAVAQARAAGVTHALPFGAAFALALSPTLTFALAFGSPFALPFAFPACGDHDAGSRLALGALRAGVRLVAPEREPGHVPVGHRAAPEQEQRHDDCPHSLPSATMPRPAGHGATR